ncbi:hypothetical protein AB0O28_36145 [Microbispora sp. NPDC088329]
MPLHSLRTIVALRTAGTPGFDALQTEGDPAPTAFTLNGTTCS